MLFLCPPKCSTAPFPSLSIPPPLIPVPSPSAPPHLPADVPVVGCVTRLTHQKGIHLIKHAAWRALERGAQFVLLGSAPDPKVQQEFQELAEDLGRQYPDRVKLWFAYDEPLRWAGGRAGRRGMSRRAQVAAAGSGQQRRHSTLLNSRTGPSRILSNGSALPPSLQSPDLRRVRPLPRALHV